MFQNKPYRLIPLARCVLGKLYVEHVNDNDSELFSAEEVKNLFSIPVSRNLLSSALEELYVAKNSNETLVVRSGARKAEWKYRISSRGIQTVEKALQNSGSDIAYFLANGDAALEDVAGMEGKFWTAEDLVDLNAWTQIQLEEDEDFQKAISSLNKTLESINKNNEFESKYPDEKRGLLDALNSGISVLKSKKVTRSQIDGLIIKPLKWIATTFANTALGEIAKETAKFIVKWISSYFS